MMYGLTQEELADRAGLSKALLRGWSAVTSPLHCHAGGCAFLSGHGSCAFFQRFGARAGCLKAGRYVYKSDEDAKSTTCWLVPNARKKTGWSPSF